MRHSNPTQSFLTNPPASLHLHHSLQLLTAQHTCTSAGQWTGLNTTLCPYTSEVTRILQQFSITNISESGTSLLRSTQSLRNFTGDEKRVLSDADDVVFLARTVQYYTRELLREHELTNMNKQHTSTMQRIKSNIARGMTRQPGRDNVDASDDKKNIAVLLLDIIGTSMSASKGEYDIFTTKIDHM